MISGRNAVDIMQLPAELIELIILYSGYNLSLTSKRFYALGNTTLIKARLLLIDHGLASAPQFLFSPSPLMHLIQASSSFNITPEPSHYNSASITNLDSVLDERRPIHLHALVQDSRFNPEIGLTILKTTFNDPDYLETLSEYACITNAISIIKHLYPLPSENATRVATDKMMHEALVQAALCNRHEVAAHMLKAGSDPNYCNSAALGMACKHGATETVAEIIRFGVDVNAHDGFALVWAARMGNAEIVRMLLDSGADIACRGGLPLMWASEHGRPDILQMLVDHAGDTALIHVQDDYCLRWASARGHIEVVEMLMKWGADVHALDDFPLRHAVHFGHSELVSVLCKWGADPMAADGEALRWAEMIGDKETLVALTRAVEGRRITMVEE